MKKIFLILTVLNLGIANASNADKTALKMDYIDKWRTTAIQQMIHTKIPASITLAQGIIESASGTSELATKGNNHFGIKCHEWEGDRMFHDDDLKGECFRVYSTAELSFIDHSEFLINRPRYATLFTLNTTDYVGWARGLKKAGYATNPKYAEILIGLIEEFHLDDYDAAVLPQRKKHSFLTPGRSKDGHSHKVEEKENKSKYIVAQTGDTYYRISQEFSMAMWELRQYNDFEAKKDVLEEGDLVYLEPKKRINHDQKNYVVKTKKETLTSISQNLGIKLKTLEKKNQEWSNSAVIPVGTTLKM